MVVKTQIQVPEKLYREIQAFAKAQEWSLAETFRRSAEWMLQVYPHGGRCQETVWNPPSSAKVKWNGLDDDALRSAASVRLQTRL